jgi:hypothetical protein
MHLLTETTAHIVAVPIALLRRRRADRSRADEPRQRRAVFGPRRTVSGQLAGRTPVTDLVAAGHLGKPPVIVKARWGPG